MVIWQWAILIILGGIFLVGLVYCRQIDLLTRLGQRRVAVKLLCGRIERRPKDAPSLVKRARLYYQEGKFRLAADDYNRALDLGLYKRKEMIYTELGQTYFAAGNYPLALAALETAYAARGRFHPTLAWLAIVHYALRDFAEARIWWQSARKQYPRYARLNGANWVRPQPGWLSPPSVEAQKIVALLNAHP